MKWKFLLIIISGFLTLLALMRAGGQASGEGTNQATGNKTPRGLEQNGPPWFGEPGWNYRRPITITNNGDIDLPWYQVLVRLDSSNFDFSLANIDGSDLRFTMFEGTVPIPFWIESWDSQNQLAYVWVKALSLDHGEDTIIYLYYNNPDALPASDGALTFDGFDDDWTQFSTGGLNREDEQSNTGITDDIQSSFNWIIIEGTPTVSDTYLILGNGMGIKSISTFSNQAVGFKANFGPGSGNEWIGFYDEGTLNLKRVMIGDRTTDPTNLYLQNFNTVEAISMIPRGGNDWHGQDHIFEARWCNFNVNCADTKSIADVDHGIMGTSLTLQVPASGTQLPVTLHNDNTGTASSLQVDWVYVRKYTNNGSGEPSVAIGEEQGLVELGINITDTPDPLPAGEALTYHLTISNIADIDAPGVIVTDTVPTDVLIGEISPSQGSCLIDQLIICDLNTIQANSEANITVVVTPTLDGWLTNTASVGSPGAELDILPNTEETFTLVDSVPPVLNWENPVHNGGTYISYGGPVILEASATDNDKVEWVEFILWDHIGNSYVSLGTDPDYPYQMELDSNLLIAEEVYQLFVRGSDWAGNLSDPFDPLQRIYIERRNSVFLPLMVK